MVKVYRHAHFVGKYDSSKSKIFWLLTTEPDTWYSPSEIHWITGVPISSIRWQCRRLHAARPPYIKRQTRGDKWHLYCYQYGIGQRGLRWWINGLKNGLPLDRYLAEILAYQQQRDVPKVANDGNSQ